MNILDSRFKYTPSHATNIRDTFSKVNDEDDMRCRIEGALELMRKLSEKSNVTPIKRDLAVAKS